VGAIALFFGWMNLILYFRRLSSYGQYVIMLTTMFVTLVKVRKLYRYGQTDRQANRQTGRSRGTDLDR